MTTLNTVLLTRTMNHIEHDPQCWDQATLGVTTDDGQVIADFPGWAVMLAEPIQRPPRGYRDGSGAWVPADQWLVHGIWAPSYAAKLLGLGVLQRTVFFHSRWRSLAALRAGVNLLLETGGEVGPTLLTTTMQDAMTGS